MNPFNQEKKVVKKNKRVHAMYKNIAYNFDTDNTMTKGKK